MAAFNKIPVFFVLLAICAVSVTNADGLRVRQLGVATQASNQLESGANSFRSSLPRLNWKFQPVSKNFNLGNINYIESLVLIALFGIIPAIFTFVLTIWFIFSRCCGCSKLCCGTTEEIENPSKFVLLILRTVISCAALGICVCLVVTLVGTTGLGNTITDFRNETHVAVTDVTTSGAALQANVLAASRLTNVSISSTEQAGFAVLNATLSSVQSSVDSNLARMDLAEGRRELVMWGALAFLSLATGFGVYCAYMGHGKLSYFTVILCGVAGVMAWLSFGAHLAAAVMMTDFCRATTTLSSTISQGLPPSPVSVGVSAYLSCVSNTTVGYVYEPVNAAAYSLTGYLNAAALSGAYPAAFRASIANLVVVNVTGTGNMDVPATLAASSGVTRLPRTPVPCFCPCQSIPGEKANCDANCGYADPFKGSCSTTSVDGSASTTPVGPHLQALAQTEPTVASLAVQLQKLNASRAVLQDFQSCSYVATPLRQVNQNVCVLGIRSIDFLWSSGLALALLLLPFTLASAWGIKRFDVDKEEPHTRRHVQMSVGGKKPGKRRINTADYYYNDSRL